MAAQKSIIPFNVTNVEKFLLPKLHSSMPRSLKAVIFDCDGTLADTMPIHYRAWCRLLDAYAIPFPEAQFYRYGGIPTGKIIELLAEEHQLTLSDIPAMVRQKESYYLELLTEVGPIIPVCQLAYYFASRLPVAVASGGYRDVVHQTLQKLHLRELFPVVVTAEDTTNHKPEPDVYLKAAQLLEVPPEGCLVFEDTAIGIEAAKRAGMKACDVALFLQAPNLGDHPDSLGIS